MLLTSKKNAAQQWIVLQIFKGLVHFWINTVVQNLISSLQKRAGNPIRFFSSLRHSSVLVQFAWGAKICILSHFTRMCWPIPPFLLVQTATCCESWHAKIKRAIFNVWELFARCFLNGFDESWLWLFKRGDRRCFYSVTAWGFRLCLKNGIFVAVVTVVAGSGLAGFWCLLSLTSYPAASCRLPPSIPLASLGIWRKYLDHLSSLVDGIHE